MSSKKYTEKKTINTIFTINSVHQKPLGTRDVSKISQKENYRAESFTGLQARMVGGRWDFQSLSEG